MKTYFWIRSNIYGRKRPAVCLLSDVGNLLRFFFEKRRRKWTYTKYVYFVARYLPVMVET